jgi:VWFA-related protein
MPGDGPMKKPRGWKQYFLAVIFVVAGLTGLIPIAAHSQEKPLSPNEPASENPNRTQDSVLVGMDLNTISLLVTARNNKGDYLSRLQANDFLVVEDGVERPIQMFKEDTIPVNVIFLVDASYSVNEVLPNISEAAVNYASHLRPGDKFSAVVFAHKPIKVLDWTDDVASFQRILKNLKTFGKTALYDSMEFGINTMFEHVQGKKGMVILSDGVDNSSRSTLPQVMKLASERQVTIYPIINAFPTSEKYREMAKFERQKLDKVSKYFLSYVDTQNEWINLMGRNGGRIIFSDGYGDLKTIYASLVDELKNQYVLSYQPQSNAPVNREFREISIKLRNKPGQVQVRLGYFQQ